VRLSTSHYNESGHTLEESRLYFDIPASGAGTDGTNYDATFFAYDDNGRRVRVKEPHGTIRRTVYDALGRVTSRSMGTNDPDVAGTDDMVTTEALEYDGNADDGNGYLTKRTLYVEDSATGQRVTTYAHDARGRVLLQTNPTAPHVFRKYDNEGRAVATGLFSSTASIVVGTDDPTTETANRLALTESSFDETGQRWKSVRHKIDAADGSDDDTLLYLTWHDAEGRVLKEDGPQLSKTTYDRIGRTTHRFVLCEDNDTAYADVDDASGDYLLEEHQTVYESGTSDDVVLSVQIDRLQNDWGVGATTGVLDTGADADALLVTAANLEGRAQITASWFDRFGRVTDIAQYGDNAGSNLDRDGLSVPSRSDTVLITSTTYGTDGEVLTMTDPRGLVARTERDDAGRTTKEIKNYNAGVSSGNPANPDDNQTVRYEYVDGLRTKIVADMPSGETDQETLYIYGTLKGTPSASKIASGHLLRATKYPDSTNTGTTPSAIDSDSSDVVSHAYNARGEEVQRKDQAGNVFDIERDDAGREIHRRVTTLASGFDGAVRRQSRTYDTLGRPSLVTQYDAATSGSVTDEASYTYDGWGGVTSFKEDKDSAVGASGYYETAYTYAKATTGRNTIRRSQVTLPGGKAVTIAYTKDKDDSVSRVSRLTAGGVVLVRYDYLGVTRVVRTQYGQPQIATRVFDESDSFSGYLDSFNRIVRNAWFSESPSPDKAFYDVTISYDRNSNITWVEDDVHVGFDVKYTMDDLDRLIDAEEGTRSGSSIATRTRHQTWLQSGTSQLGHTGNWVRSKLDLDGDDNWNETDEYDDTRTHNAVNELTARDTDSNGSSNFTLSYDAAGNLTDDGEDYEYEYDAFYRLRKVKNQSATLLAEYRYNGLGHMIGVHEDTDADGDCDGSDVWFYPAYDEGWREVARYRDADSSPKEQFVNATAGLDGYGGSSYINDVVCRERDNTGGWLAASDGTLEERYFYCPNWRGDVSALVHSGRYMAEWVKYSPYGVPFGLPGGDANSDGDNDAADATQIQAWIDGAAYDVRGDVDLDGDVDSADKTLAQGAPIGATQLGRSQLSDEALRNCRSFAGHQTSRLVFLQHSRHRFVEAKLARWLQRDLLVYADGNSVYQVNRLSPVVFVDPDGRAGMRPAAGALGYIVNKTLSCCDKAREDYEKESPGRLLLGVVLCCEGTRTRCTYDAGKSPNWPWGDDPQGNTGGSKATGIVKHCAGHHEAAHERALDNDSASDCGPSQGPGKPYGVNYDDPQNRYDGAIAGDAAFKECVDEALEDDDCGQPGTPAHLHCESILGWFGGMPPSHGPDGTQNH
jgi:YD repeat-containing protein